MVTLPDAVKLIDVGPVLDDRKPNLVQMIGGKDKNDYRRKVLITHWDGFRFATDCSVDFMGTSLDALLIGRFRVPKPKPEATTTATAQLGGQNAIPLQDIFKKRKKNDGQSAMQLVTTEGIYAWSKKTLSRLFPAPPNLKMMLKRSDAGPDQMVINSGDTASLFEVGEVAVQPSSYEFTTDEENVEHSGYARYGVGTQPYAEAREFLPNIRYVQSYWNGRNRWLLCLLKGKPANLPDAPEVTTGDQLVVYVPKAENRDKNFWELTHADDWEESWRSEQIGGHVLDVRLGDPKNDGKEGIVVLTASIVDKKEKDRQLLFYTIPNGFINR